jgi:hypothetical protein
LIVVVLLHQDHHVAFSDSRAGWDLRHSGVRARSRQRFNQSRIKLAK